MNVRGLAGAHKTMLLTAVAYNLKKLLKYRPERQASLAVPCTGRFWQPPCAIGSETGTPTHMGAHKIAT